MDLGLVEEFLRVSFIMKANRASGRALTVKKETVFWQPWLKATDDSSKLLNQKQTTKWKRDRRSRLPEYSRKSDPKFAETFNISTESSFQDTNGSCSETNQSNSLNGSSAAPDTPLDMTIRQRGLPPSYAQTISNPEYRSSYRPSVIQNNVPPLSREELPSGISMCDPIIEEHFRKSLGDDYHTLFQNNNASKELTTHKSPPRTPTTSVIELMDSTGLSVDEHFAKALGDTWAKLNKKEPEIKPGAHENNLVST